MIPKDINNFKARSRCNSMEKHTFKCLRVLVRSFMSYGTLDRKTAGLWTGLTSIILMTEHVLPWAPVHWSTAHKGNKDKMPDDILKVLKVYERYYRKKRTIVRICRPKLPIKQNLKFMNSQEVSSIWNAIHGEMRW